MRARRWVPAAWGGLLALAISGLALGAATTGSAPEVWRADTAPVGAAPQLAGALTLATLLPLPAGRGLLAWRRRLAGANRMEYLALLTLGLLFALVLDTHAWAVPLVIVPGVVVYRSLERQVQSRQQTLDVAEALVDIVDVRDPYTADHSRRVAAVARELAIGLKLAPGEVDLVERAARVHDIGKIVVDLTLLTKERGLTDTEWTQIKRHPIIGADILGHLPDFALVTAYVRHHHEHFDGAGYPDGLRGDGIPLGARIIAVADAYDAMTHARAYRSQLPPAGVLAEFTRQRGRCWDPRVVDVLFALVTAGRIPMPTTGRGRRRPLAGR